MHLCVAGIVAGYFTVAVVALLRTAAADGGDGDDVLYIIFSVLNSWLAVA